MNFPKHVFEIKATFLFFSSTMCVLALYEALGSLFPMVLSYSKKQSRL